MRGVCGQATVPGLTSAIDPVENHFLEISTVENGGLGGLHIAALGPVERGGSVTHQKWNVSRIVEISFCRPVFGN